jgi:uncharacterized protein (DUF39 family)
LFNPRNAYQNYNCAVNSTRRTIYTYMGALKPLFGNATYSTSGQISPLLNDPYFKTIGVGTRIFLGGGQGYVAFYGTQHVFDVPRSPNGIPTEGAGTLCVIGDMKKMDPNWIAAASIQGYGVSMYVGIGVPIPILNEEMAQFTAVKDEDIVTQIIDYGGDYPKGINRSLGTVTYKELKDGLQIDRTSCTRFLANQLRVLMTAAAYVLLQELRLHLARTRARRYQVSTLREHLLKIGVRLIASVRRVVLHLPRSYPFTDLWSRLAVNLGAVRQ